MDKYIIIINRRLLVGSRYYYYLYDLLYGVRLGLIIRNSCIIDWSAPLDGGIRWMMIGSNLLFIKHVSKLISSLYINISYLNILMNLIKDIINPGEYYFSPRTILVIIIRRKITRNKNSNLDV